VPRRSSLIAAAVLLGWTVATLLVDPRADVPLIDDWTYAMSVERLLAGGGLRVPAWSSTFPPAQIAWGALFTALAGFSYTVLRISTLVLAVLATLAFHALLRALGCARGHALVGALTLALYPVMFVLSFTFMTDVPMLAGVVASLWAIITGLPRPHASSTTDPGYRGAWIGVGLALAVVASLVRPVAIAVPAALLVTLVTGGARRGRAQALVLLAIALVTTAAAMALAGRYWTGAAEGEGGLGYRIERLRYLLLVSPRVYAEALLSMLAHLGLAAAPALLATAPPPRRWPWRLAVVLVVAAMGVSLLAPQAVDALKPRATWSVQELGAARPLLVGELPYGGMRRVLGLAATGIGLLAAACLVVRTSVGLRSGGPLRSVHGTLLLAFGAISLALCFALWFFYDRYYLPLVPVVIALALGSNGREPPDTRQRGPALHTVAAGTVLAGLLALDVSGVRDMLAFARTVDGVLGGLVASGVPWRQIDAGYAENGWHLYAHPENLPPGADVERDVPHVTVGGDLPYAIANGPLPGYAIREIVPLPRLWASTDRVYVLVREGEPDSTASSPPGVRRP